VDLARSFPAHHTRDRGCSIGWSSTCVATVNCISALASGSPSSRRRPPFLKRLGEKARDLSCFCSGPGSNKGRGQRRCVVLKTPETAISHLRIAHVATGENKRDGGSSSDDHLVTGHCSARRHDDFPRRESFNGQRCLRVAFGSRWEIVGREVPGVVPLCFQLGRAISRSLEPTLRRSHFLLSLQRP
jgi:hypothetical protein